MERRTAIVELTHQQMTEALCSVLPQAKLLAFELVQSGRANTNYFLETDRGKLLLRLHVRDGSLGAKERALQRLVAAQVPTARALGGREAGEPLDFAFSLLEHVSGTLLEQAFVAADRAQLETAARELGQALGRLTAYRFDQAGDLSASDSGALALQPWSLTDFFHWALFESPAGSRLGDLREPLWTFLQRTSSEYPDTWPNHLVHGDFNPTNLILDDAGRLAAIIDWEFAHAGKIWADLGNLLRHRPALPLPDFFAPLVLEGLQDTGIHLPTNWRALTLITDLSSACEFLSSTDDRPQTHSAALTQIRQTLAELDP